MTAIGEVNPNSLLPLRHSCPWETSDDWLLWVFAQFKRQIQK